MATYIMTIVREPWVMGLFILFMVYIVHKRVLELRRAEREPPLIPEPFPFVGHIYGLLRYGSLYYSRIFERTQHPIFTLRVPSSRIYVVTSPELVSEIDQNARTISFEPFLVLFVRRIIAPSRQAMAIISGNTDGTGSSAFRQETMKTIHNNLSIGKSLEKLTIDMLRSLVPQLHHRNSVTHPRLSLFKWVKQIVVQASTDAMYGPYNPFHDQCVADSFWSVDAGFAFLGLNVLPQWTARKGVIGRDRLSEAFLEYYTNDQHYFASDLVRARYEVDRKFGFGIKDTARFELSICIGLLVNIVPMTFWCLYLIYQRPNLLEEVRNNLSEFIIVREQTPDPTSYAVEMDKLLTANTLLSACIQEALRLLSTSAAGRVLMEDTWLDNNYLLKKNSVLMIPSVELHNNATIWGDDFREFNPHRWLQKDGVRVPASAYRAFGGGSWPCPGRKFSSREMTAALALIILQYDLLPDSGFWKEIKSGFHISTSVNTPLEDIDVHIRARKGLEDADWEFCWKGSMIQVAY